MVLRRWIFVVIEIVNQPDDAPEFFISAKLPRVCTHAGFDRQRVLSQALRLSELGEKIPGGNSIVGHTLNVAILTLQKVDIVPPERHCCPERPHVESAPLANRRSGNP
jgi:hypothetical protein